MLLGFLLTGYTFAALPPLLTVSELRPGMRGKTLTVMQGTEIVELETEILGVQ
jgi:hypothetical protein